MAKTTVISVPARGRKWVTGAFVRDSHTLYRVAGNPIRYHEDCLPHQKVTKVREVPEDWTAVQRLLEIMQQVRNHGRHTPDSRGAFGRPAEQIAEMPAMPNAISWEAREEAQSYASYPRLQVSGDTLSYVEPIYDDSPVVTWLADAAMADEARALIARGVSLQRYPRASVHEIGG